jgi:hypothetical protein
MLPDKGPMSVQYDKFRDNHGKRRNVVELSKPGH